MLLESEHMIPVTQLQRELTQRVREVSETGENLYILKNNHMEAVMIPFKEYERLHNLEEIFEQLEIKTMIEKRLSGYDKSKNLSWDNIRED
ncbi:MAG: type II toxin-antitoxin system Phd/YefM family antitoxin [Spirochaetales bacterium]|nr:type II toxin-antitoxin system Phd/YefM family antitoxin [Spirochaetales bacterium]